MSIYRVELSIEAANPREALEKACWQAAIGNAVVTAVPSGETIYMKVPMEMPACQWTEDWEGNWHTACGWAMCIDWEPDFESFPYCPRCACRIRPTRYVEPAQSESGADARKGAQT